MISFFLVTVLASLFAIILAADVTAWTPLICRKLIERSIGLLPEEQRERYHEEWLSHLDETPGTFCKISEALGFLISVKRQKWDGKVRASATLGKMIVKSYQREIKYRYFLIQELKPLKQRLLSLSSRNQFSNLLQRVIEIEDDEVALIGEQSKHRAEVLDLLKIIIKS